MDLKDLSTGGFLREQSYHWVGWWTSTQELLALVRLSWGWLSVNEICRQFPLSQVYYLSHLSKHRHLKDIHTFVTRVLGPAGGSWPLLGSCTTDMFSASLRDFQPWNCAHGQHWEGLNCFHFSITSLPFWNRLVASNHPFLECKINLWKQDKWIGSCIYSCFRSIHLTSLGKMFLSMLVNSNHTYY